MSQLTVKELSALLASQPQGAKVFVEGCDCCGKAEGVKLNEDGSVLVTRKSDVLTSSGPE